MPENARADSAHDDDVHGDVHDDDLHGGDVDGDDGHGDLHGRVEFVHRSWPADPAQLSVIRRELAGWLAPLALTDDEVAGVVLAVDEAAANAVRHAYGPGGSGVVELTMWTEPGTLCVEVVDHGSWVPPVTDTAPDGLADGGRGIPLMSSMAEAVLIHHDSRGSRVLLRHPVSDDRTDDDAADRNPVGAVASER